MLINDDNEIKKSVDQELDKLPITVDLLKSLGYTAYEFNPRAIRRTVTIHIKYKHTRKYGYFKKKCGILKAEILLFGDIDKEEHVIINTTAIIDSQNYSCVLKTIGDLKNYLYIRMTEERIEAERENLKDLVDTISIPI